MREIQFKMMYQKNPGGTWGQEILFGEAPARKECNRLWLEGFYKVQLWSRARVGWTLVKEVTQHPGVAKAKQKAHAELLSKKAEDYHKQLFG